MTLSVRSYATEEQAKATVSALHNAGFTDSSVTLFGPSMTPGGEARMIADAVYRGELDEDESGTWLHEVRQGHWVVAVKAMLGKGQLAEDILAVNQPLAVGGDAQGPSDAAPLSDFLGLPTLSRTPPKAMLLEIDGKQSFGFKLLSDNATPLSSLFGMKLLSAGKSKTQLSNKAAPFSSMIGLPLLKKS